MKFNRTVYFAQKNEAAETFEVAMPSGATFTLKRPALQVYFASGEMPGGLMEKLVLIEQSASADDSARVLAAMNPREQIEMTKFFGVLVRSALVLPRIVSDPQTDDEIRFEELDDADFMAIIEWTKTGGAGGDYAAKFRRQPKRAARNRADGA